MINYHFKGLYKTTCFKTNSNFSQFFFSHWLLYESFFYFLMKAFVSFKKLIRFHRQAFIVYRIGENLKIPIEIFGQKLTVFNVIFAFLDHLKPKILVNLGGQHRVPPSLFFFQNIWIRPCFSRRLRLYGLEWPSSGFSNKSGVLETCNEYWFLLKLFPKWGKSCLKMYFSYVFWFLKKNSQIADICTPKWVVSNLLSARKLEVSLRGPRTVQWITHKEEMTKANSNLVTRLFWILLENKENYIRPHFSAI